MKPVNKVRLALILAAVLSLAGHAIAHTNFAPALPAQVLLRHITTWGCRHPGGLDSQGCHVCDVNCDKWGVRYKEKHCHGPGGKITYPGDSSVERPRHRYQRDMTTKVTRDAYVEKVSDGDTIKVRLLPSGKKVTVRLLGIDCPESHKNKKCKRDGTLEQNSLKGRKNHGSIISRHDCKWQIPRGLKASKRAAKLLKHKKIQIECDGECRKGTFKRALRYVRLKSGEDLGLKMIKEGYCEDFSWKYPHPRYWEYLEAQREARQAGKGIWADEKLSPLFIGKALAERLSVKKGDVVWIVVPPVRTPTNPPKAWFRIGGIFETGNMVLDEKRVCATEEGLGPLRRERKLGIIEGIVSSQHNIMGVDAYELKEEEPTAESCKQMLGVP